MSTQSIEVYRPDFTKLYGLTHDPTGAPVIRAPRTVKVSIGRPKGKDIHVFIDPRVNKDGLTGDICIQVGKEVKGRFRPNQINEAKVFYRSCQAPERRFPEKLPYFTFSKVGPDGNLEPDFNAIVAHGPTPIEIDVVFTDDRPLAQAYEFWSASGLRCKGNGIDAERSVEFATGYERFAAEQKASGFRVFPIKDGCWTRGCPYAKPLVKGDKEYRQCAPHSRLSFQLINDIRLGGRAMYDTTGMRSSSQLFSCILELAIFTGGGNPERGYVRGIPLRLCLRPFVTNHNGQPGKAYAVSLEFRAESIGQIRQKLLDFQSQFNIAPQIAAAPEVKQIAAAPPVTEEVVEFTDVDTEIMHGEFDAGSAALDDEGDLGDPADAPPPTDSDKAAEASVSRTAALREQLAAKAAATEAPKKEESETVKSLPKSAIDTEPAADTAQSQQPVFLTAALVKDRARQVASPDLPIPTMEQFLDAVHAEGMDTKEPAAAYATFTAEWRKVVVEAVKKQGGAKGGFNF